MRKIVLTALFVTPLLGGAAFAQGLSHAGEYAYRATQDGPAAYSQSAIAQWWREHPRQNAMTYGQTGQYSATTPGTQTD